MMFGKKKMPAGTIDSLIGSGTTITGDIRFKGGLRIDGQIIGNVIADGEGASMLVLSENARVVGEVKAHHVVVNGTIEGAVFVDEMIELQPKAKVTGNIRYNALEMHHGAVVEGTLSHADSAKPALKLAASNE
jgi:cytoskeletal protein CcmA (bactofilin family)